MEDEPNESIFSPIERKQKQELPEGFKSYFNVHMTKEEYVTYFEAALLAYLS